MIIQNIKEKMFAPLSPLENKKGLIMGVANDKSIAWKIAETTYNAGASLAFNYQGEILKRRIEPLVTLTSSPIVAQCDVTKEEELDKLFDEIESKWGRLDFVVHSIAFSQKEELRGRFIDTSIENFLLTMNVSCYSLIAIAKRAEKLMYEGGSIITLTYYGSEKVMPSYNIMGPAKAALESSVRYLASDLGPKNIRVNAISAGPIRTLASSAIGEFKSMQRVHEEVSPLRRNVTLEDVANSALYLASDLSSGVTGSVIYVDCGYNILGITSSSN